MISSRLLAARLWTRGQTMLKGYIDEVSLRTVRGWAIGGDGSPPELIVSVNGIEVTRCRPSLDRPDLASFGRRDLGFNIDTRCVLNAGDTISITNASGEHLIGSPKRITKIQPTKEEKALWLVSREMKILEIGPAYNPIAPRSQGWNSFSLDHATQEELRTKYRGQQLVDRIEPVDYLWKGGPIETAVPKREHGTFDVVIASHVIEHIPDPIAFFMSASVLLKEGGLVSLVVPDKRLTFDFFKPLTATSDYLQAHHLRRTRHSKKTVFDNIAYNVTEKGDISWYARPVGEFGFLAEDVLTAAAQAFDETREDESAAYVDYHGTIYTPSSFTLIIFELSQLGVLPFSIRCTFPTSGCEFYVTLRKGPPAPVDHAALQQERLRLLKATVRELGQQARWLADDEPLS